MFRDVEVAISRTRAEYDGRPELREVEALWLDMVKNARRFLYIENQYFTSVVKPKLWVADGKGAVELWYGMAAV